MLKIRKIFKKISWFDRLLIILVLLLGIAFVVFFYRKPTYVKMRVKVTDQDVLYQRTDPQNWYANRFEIGDNERDTLGRDITRITGVQTFNTDSKNKVVYLDLEVLAVYDSRTKLYSARGKPLIFGTPMHFNLSNITFDGIVTEFPGSQYQKGLKVITTTVKALGRGVEPALAEAVKAGDKIYDSNGELLVEVKEVKISPAQRVTETAAGDLLLRLDPLFVDLQFTLVVRTQTYRNENYIFDNLPLKVGEIVPLNFKTISLFPMITSFTLN